MYMFVLMHVWLKRLELITLPVCSASTWTQVPKRNRCCTMGTQGFGSECFGGLRCYKQPVCVENSTNQQVHYFFFFFPMKRG